jgi:N-acetylglucosaminyldiphosphoundecaprenol N-acetyl-beta-D-mannosaminyltransferase
MTTAKASFETWALSGEAPPPLALGSLAQLSELVAAAADGVGETPLPTRDIWGIPFAHVTVEESVDRIGGMIAARTPRYVITANLNYAMLAAQQPELQPVTRDAAMILADGMPIVWRSRLGRHRRLPERVTGSELIYRLAARGAREGWRIYFLGAPPGIAAQCAAKLQSLHPTLLVAGVDAPPYRALSAAEEAEQHERIRAAKPDLLLVAFGQPKGERWIHQHYRQLGVPVSIQLGASFEFVAGSARRAPIAWQQCGMEWAYRMGRDPRRLVPRYGANALFLVRTLLGEACAALRRGG